MKTNLGDVKHLDRLARSVGARRILVSHVLPYSEAMEKEMLCLQTLTLETFTFAPGKTELSLPRIDVNNTTKDTLFSLFQGFENLTFMGNRVAVDARRCRFVHERTSFVRWDGRVGPCMGLLHAHTTYLYGLERRVRSHAFGDVRDGRPLRHLELPGLRRFPGEGQSLRLLALPRLRRLFTSREERGGLLRQHLPGLRRLPVGPGDHPMPIADIVKIFKALADPTRLRIVLLLRRRELCVCELMYILRMEQSRVSRHMRVLRDAGIAEDVREGRWIIYRIAAAAGGLVEETHGGRSPGAHRDVR